MTLPAWREVPIARSHERASFDCGVESLNRYLARFALQNHVAGVSKTFVAVPTDRPGRVLGYYSLTAAQIEADRVPREALRRVGRYPIPVILLARLAVERGYQGWGLGGQLLLAAGERALAVSHEVGVRALAIEAKDQRAAVWYARFGATPLEDRPLSLILPLATIAAALDST